MDAQTATFLTARVLDIIETTDGVMNMFGGERVLESYLLGAVGYVNPYGNYIARASHRFCDFMTEDRVDDAKKVQRLIDKMQDIIGEGHPTYGHQCYSKALARAAGYPMGDVRPPLTTFRELGQEGEQRVETLKSIMKELDELMERLDSRLAA